MTKNQSDFTISSDKKIVLFVGNCEVRTNVNIGSDHRMVRARVKIYRIFLRLKKIQNEKTLKLDPSVLEKSATSFRIELKKQI